MQISIHHAVYLISATLITSPIKYVLTVFFRFAGNHNTILLFANLFVQSRKIPGTLLEKL